MGVFWRARVLTLAMWLQYLINLHLISRYLLCQRIPDTEMEESSLRNVVQAITLAASSGGCPSCWTNAPCWLWRFRFTSLLPFSWHLLHPEPRLWWVSYIAEVQKRSFHVYWLQWIFCLKHRLPTRLGSCCHALHRAHGYYECTGYWEFCGRCCFVKASKNGLCLPSRISHSCQL